MTRCIEAGINVNVTLLFSVERYAGVIDAYLSGLERRLERGLPLETIASVASFFVSRVDGKVDPLLDRTPGHPLRGKIAIANAARAYLTFERSLASERWGSLSRARSRASAPALGFHQHQRPAYPDTYYVEALIAPADGQHVTAGDPGSLPRSRAALGPDPAGSCGSAGQLEALAGAGIDLEAVTHELEVEGVAKFAASHAAVLAGIEAKAEALATR